MWFEITKELPVPEHENGVRILCLCFVRFSAACNASRTSVVVVGSTRYHTRFRVAGLGAGADGDHCSPPC